MEEDKVIKMISLNTEYEMFMCYLEEYEQGYTDLDYDEWLDEFYNELESFDYDMEVFTIND